MANSSEITASDRSFIFPPELQIITIPENPPRQIRIKSKHKNCGSFDRRSYAELCSVSRYLRIKSSREAPWKFRNDESGLFLFAFRERISRNRIRQSRWPVRWLNRMGSTLSDEGEIEWLETWMTLGLSDEDISRVDCWIILSSRTIKCSNGFLKER